ncbi:MAG: hypothetical protein MUQ00_01825 [Candidatus Aminicenantes bacterium]|nr:hypothetical protein [Candidatus Aminicenantes bacterium]
MLEKTLKVIEEITRQGIIKAYAIGGGIAATYYIEPMLTYDLDIFFIPAKEGLDVLAPIYDYAKERGFSTQAESILIEGFPVQFIPAYNDLVREAVENATTLKYRDVEAKVVTAEYLAAIALQTGRAKDRERVIRLLDEAVIDRTVLGRILGSFGLADKFKKFEKQFHEE